MAENLIFPEFREQFELTRYPFTDSSSLLTDTGMLLPANTFFDMVLHGYGTVGPVHLRSVTVTASRVVLTFADLQLTEVAYGRFSIGAVPDNLPLADPAGLDAGLLVSEAIRLTAFTTWPIGTHTFTPDAASLVPSVVVPLPAVGVRAIELPDGSQLVGDVWIVGDDGVVVREQDGDIRIDLVGDPLFRRRLCDPLNQFSSPEFVRTINGQSPDQYGNYDIQVADEGAPNTILRIYTQDGELFIESAGRAAGD